MRSLLVIEYIHLITTLLSIKAKVRHPKIGNGKDLKSGLKTVGGGHHIGSTPLKGRKIPRFPSILQAQY
jgi:hypothetical protein